MSHIDYSEKGFEENIEAYLLQSGYVQGKKEDYNKQYALDKKLLFQFLESTQPTEIEKLKKIHKEQFESRLLDRLSKELTNRGMIDVIRHGIDDYGVNLKLAYSKPATGLNEKLVDLYNKNLISVTRQVHYSLKNENSVDMLISVNGLPVIVLELKNQLTGQNVENARDQYKYDRDPKDLLFAFKKRAIVFFAVDTDDVYMTTRLLKENTVFLPFNMGNEGGKGNPPVEDGYKTSYLWEEVLQKDSLMDILFNFIFIEKDDRKNKENLVFPRYHQLDVVRKLEADTKIKGAGNNYLIQHSAGSGKTNSISWLAHRLAKLHDENENNVYHSVIVITDRRVLDRQLQDAIYQLEHKTGFVEKIEKDSNQLAEALNKGTKIIISTLQKFPFVLDKVKELGDKRYAIIVDEAHSSQTGKSSNALKIALSAKSEEEALELAMNEDRKSENTEVDAEQEILNELDKIGKRSNISFYAFTATPKQKTIEMFGTLGADGKPHSFHIYSMKQAIQEGFILDVLQNYTTYATYYQVSKTIEDDPELNKKKAIKAIARFVSLHPHNIAQKTEIMVEHFRHITKNKIGGRAKAMVVTSSRLHAVRYFLAFNKYLQEKNYIDIKALVAFSGEVDDSGVEYTEAEMNKFSEKQLPEKFETDEYQVLLVAEKYQTGFDQPLLHTMFVDKKLDGVKAVQTLSRLNRACKGKDDTFVLDFINNWEDIQESFKPYYQATEIESVTDPNILYDFRNKLNEFHVYTDGEVDTLADIYYKHGKSKAEKQGKFNSVLDKAAERFFAIKTIDEKDDFKSFANKYLRAYSFLVQIMPFSDKGLHKLYIFLTFLIKKLKGEMGQAVKLSDEISLEYYRNQKTFDGTIILEDGEELPPIKFTGGKPVEEKEKLSTIIEKLNEAHGTDFTETDLLSIMQIKEDFAKDEKLVMNAKANQIDNFRFAFETKFKSIVNNRMNQNQDFFIKVLDDDGFRKTLIDLMIVETYEMLKRAR